MDFTAYNYETYLKTPIWRGDLVTHESLLFVEGEDGEYVCELMYEPDRIVTFRNSALDTEYTEGADYILEGEKITLIKEGSVPRMARAEYYPEIFDPEKAIDRVGGGYIALRGGSYFHSFQVAVTYRHSEKWTGPVPEYKGGLLPKTMAKLASNEVTKVLFYGDSITAGGDSSGVSKVRPNAPMWPVMTVQGLKKLYPDAVIDYNNTALGGANSTWGVENADSLAADIRPDLCFIAFGMNDATQGTGPETVRKNIESIMDTVRAKNPDCEFVIVATMLPNAEVAFGGSSMLKTHPDQAAAFMELEGEGVAVMNMTEMSAHMLSLKPFKDMTGNNVNHPNDFLARIYAETALATLCRDYK